LSKRRAIETINLAAEIQGEEFYDRNYELRWHFIHGRWGQAKIRSTLPCFLALSKQ
jgi:hypothetical protein